MICTQITKNIYLYQCGYAMFDLSNVLYITLQGFWTAEGSKSEILHVIFSCIFCQSSCSIKKPTTFLWAVIKAGSHCCSLPSKTTEAVRDWRLRQFSQKLDSTFALKEEQRGDTEGFCLSEKDVALLPAGFGEGLVEHRARCSSPRVSSLQ